MAGIYLNRISPVKIGPRAMPFFKYAVCQPENTRTRALQFIYGLKQEFGGYQFWIEACSSLYKRIDAANPILLENQKIRDAQGANLSIQQLFDRESLLKNIARNLFPQYEESDISILALKIKIAIRYINIIKEFPVMEKAKIQLDALLTDVETRLKGKEYRSALAEIMSDEFEAKTTALLQSYQLAPAKKPFRIISADVRAAYQTINVSTDATFEEIRSAYRREMRKIHPDLSTAKNATEMAQETIKAYSKVLGTI